MTPRTATVAVLREAKRRMTVAEVAQATAEKMGAPLTNDDVDVALRFAEREGETRCVRLAEHWQDNLWEAV